MKIFMKHSYAVITGASSGLGAEFARQLSMEGYDIILVARRKERLEALKAELDEMMSAYCDDFVCIVHTADLSDSKQCFSLMEEIASKRIGIFINNAGFGDCNEFVNGDIDKELNMIDVNVKALHILTKLVIRKFKAQGGGYLLNVGSSAGLLPAGPYMATYYASKSYVTSLTRAIACELYEAGSRIYVGCLCPGPVDTEFNDVAQVEFSLSGIGAKECVSYAIRMMKKRQVVIVPTIRMKAAVFLSKLSPGSLAVAITSHQQKRKINKNGK